MMVRKTLSQIHDEFMRDPEYRTAYEDDLHTEELPINH